MQFAQENFGARSRVPGSLDDPEQRCVNRPPRPPVPTWIGQPSERDLPLDEGHPWRIEGPLDPQQPLPDVETMGTDALAFWVPFHFYRERWGIYIRLTGVLYLAPVLKGGGLGPGDEPYLNLAERILFWHEWTHGAVEIACTRAELVARTSLYQPYYDDFEAFLHEEAICNAQALVRTAYHGPPDAHSRAEDWMGRQGPGYRDFGQWTDRLWRGMDRAGRLMLKPLRRHNRKASGPTKTFLFHEVDRYHVVATRINDMPPSPVSVLRPFPKAFGIQVLVHTNDHPPPHIHIQMPPGGPETKYVWPDLVPVDGQPPLPGKGEKFLGRYMEDYGTQIGERLRRVYGEAVP
ncbi:MAG: hypothetical protein FJ272_21940 [Planctomycetes bacterium]|nr:hypothetical protein [Planctomycetota bacterium]